ncbi:MAG: antitoxin [Alphaproteobacteria bacterium]|nr:antitoxin [Alphaproteobacteria bacterium]MCW5752333.1 antitoxin [Alphaproteobacteria bacterium]
MSRTRIFRNNRSQAIRLAKAVAFPDHVREVEVIPVGTARLVTPGSGSWRSFFEAPGASDDFMSERDQPAPQERGEG